LNWLGGLWFCYCGSMEQQHAAVAILPAYWLVVPAAWRRDAIMVVSLGLLALHDPRLIVLVGAASLGVVAVMHALAARPNRLVMVLSLAALAALFVWNKRHGASAGPLVTQAPLALVGVSYLVLKLAGAVVDAQRGTLRPGGFREALAWLGFLPTYPAGPIVPLERFREKRPAFDRAPSTTTATCWPLCGSRSSVARQ